MGRASPAGEVLDCYVILDVSLIWVGFSHKIPYKMGGASPAGEVLD